MSFKMAMETAEKERTKYKLIDLIKKQLDPLDPTPINIYEIRNYIYYGFSDEKLRSKYWKILLNYYSHNKFQSEIFYRQARKSYHEIINDLNIEDPKISHTIKTIKSEIERSSLIISNSEIFFCKDEIERILVSFSIINPSIGYVQGMINLTFAFYYVMKRSNDLDDQKYAEEDAFYLFNNLISEMASLFISDYDNESKGIKEQVNSVFEIVKNKDEELYDILVEKKLIHSMFPIKWILLLFSGDYPIDDTIWLWDKFFSDAYRFELLIYCAAATIILLRDVILSESFENCMEILQKPKIITPKLVFEIADLMRRKEIDMALLISQKIKTNKK